MTTIIPYIIVVMSTQISLPKQLYQRIRQTARLNQKSVDEYVVEIVSLALDEAELSIPVTEDQALALYITYRIVN